MMNTDLVYIVDDDPAMRQSLEWLMSSVNLSAKSFENADAFLEGYSLEQPACLLLDMRMEGMSGLALQEQLASQAGLLPTIIVTGHADVPSAVHALKKGAFDYIEKPFSNQMLIERVNEALAVSRSHHEGEQKKQAVEKKLAALTPRERDVFELLAKGEINKSIAHQLDISESTVERHRAKVMDKLGITSVTEIISINNTIIN